MRVLLFGATGMVGQGVLRECLRASDVDFIQTVGRMASGQRAPKLREVIQQDLFDLGGIESELNTFDACLFCLGVSSAAMTEPQYSRLTYNLTLGIAQTLARLNPQMTFIYVSGAGTDSTERGRIMWSRVKGKTENALQRLAFRAVYLFRPGIIQPVHGARSKTASYRILYTLASPLFPVLRMLFPKHTLTTERLGQAMLNVLRHGADKTVLEAADINAFSAVR